MNQLTPMETFKEKIISKLKEDITELMPEDALSGLIEQAVQDVFMKRSGHHHQNLSWFEEEVRKQIEPLLQKEVTKFVSSQSKDIKDKTKEILDNQLMSVLVMRAVQDQSSFELQQQIHNLSQKLSNNGIY